MAEYLIQDTTLDAIADAINAKTGGSSAMTPAEMVTAIGSIETGGGSPIEKEVYTHAQDWTSDGTGNTAAFQNAYFTKGAGMYYATIENNNATGNYKAISAVAAIGGMLTADAYVFSRLGGNVNVADASWSYYITAGAIVTIWFIPKGVFS